jgi:hypothetical protein
MSLRPKDLVGLQRQLSEDRRHKLGNRRMDRHRVGVGRGCDACRHRLDHAVDCLVAAHPEDCRAEDRVGVTVDHDLDEAARFAFLDRTANARHRPNANPHAMSFGAGLGLGQTDPSKRRIYVERVHRNAVAHPALSAVEQVRRDEFVVVE